MKRLVLHGKFARRGGPVFSRKKLKALVEEVRVKDPGNSVQMLASEMGLSHSTLYDYMKPSVNSSRAKEPIITIAFRMAEVLSGYLGREVSVSDLVEYRRASSS